MLTYDGFQCGKKNLFIRFGGKHHGPVLKRLEYLASIYPYFILGKQFWQSQNTYRIFPDNVKLQKEVGIKNIHWSSFVKKLQRLAKKYK